MESLLKAGLERPNLHTYAQAATSLGGLSHDEAKLKGAAEQIVLNKVKENGEPFFLLQHGTPELKNSARNYYGLAKSSDTVVVRTRSELAGLEAAAKKNSTIQNAVSRSAEKNEPAAKPAQA